MLKSNFFNKNKNFWSALLKYMYLRWFFHSSYITIQPYLGWLFWKSQVGASRPAVKKHAVSQKAFVHFTRNFAHILSWQYEISLDKKVVKCHFCNHLITSSWKSYVDVFMFFRNWCISCCYKRNLVGNFMFFV